MVGMEGSWKVTEMWTDWGGKVLEDHRDMEWLGWKGPERS